MVQKNTESRWKISWLKPRLLGNKQAIKPAEISDGLSRVMMARENILEDAKYNKVVPNRFVVEISPSNYRRQYEPLGTTLTQQWRERLVEHLQTANSRLGRIEYRLGGQLQIELRAAQGVEDNQVRILSRVEPDLDSHEVKDLSSLKQRGKEAAFLELINGERRWPLYPGDNIIGRDEACDIFLDLPPVQEKRLISAQHATIRIQDGQILLLDGGLSRKPSANGTYVNSQRIPEHGVYLQDRDIIILAAINPLNPRFDTPGVAAFRLRIAG